MTHLTINVMFSGQRFAILAINFSLCPFFWKVLCDTFDNQCDVLRAAFCNSGNVLCGEVAWFFLVERLHEFL